MQAINFVQELYKAVDNKNINQLAHFLAEDVCFSLANFPSTRGKTEVLEANQGFFASIHSMCHSLDNIWQVEDKLICHGQVDYIRLDKTKMSANFATILTIKEEKISDYLVYADLSNL